MASQDRMTFERFEELWLSFHGLQKPLGFQLYCDMMEEWDLRLKRASHHAVGTQIRGPVPPTSTPPSVSNAATVAPSSSNASLKPFQPDVAAATSCTTGGAPPTKNTKVASSPAAAGPCPHPGEKPLTLKPDAIREARVSYVSQLAHSASVDKKTIAKAFARPNKLCDNVQCGKDHISEDCGLLLLCSSCADLGHVAHNCTKQCKRCFSIGHISVLCTARYYKGGKTPIPTAPAQAYPIQRLKSEKPREILPLQVRLGRGAQTLLEGKGAVTPSASKTEPMLPTSTTRPMPSNPVGQHRAATPPSASSRPMPSDPHGSGGFPGFPRRLMPLVFPDFPPPTGLAGTQTSSSNPPGGVPPPASSFAALPYRTNSEARPLPSNKRGWDDYKRSP
ncbi:MAG: hypothetical protein Q9202_007191 [Teloschistes flavicans]